MMTLFLEHSWPQVAQGIALDLATLARSLEVSSEAVTQKRQEKRLPTATVKADFGKMLVLINEREREYPLNIFVYILFIVYTYLSIDTV